MARLTAGELAQLAAYSVDDRIDDLLQLLEARAIGKQRIAVLNDEFWRVGPNGTNTDWAVAVQTLQGLGYAVKFVKTSGNDTQTTVEW